MYCCALDGPRCCAWMYCCIALSWLQVKMLYREHAAALNAWKVEKGMMERQVRGGRVWGKGAGEEVLGPGERWEGVRWEAAAECEC